MESPSSSTKSRSSNRRNRSLIETLKPHVDKMSANCNIKRQEIKLLKEEISKLRTDKLQLELQLEQDNLKNKQEILRLNEIIDELKFKMNTNDNKTNHLKSNNHLNQLNIQNNQQFKNLNNLNHHSNHNLNHNLNHNSNHNSNHIQNQQQSNKLLLNKNLQKLQHQNQKDQKNDSIKELVGSTMNNWISESNKKFKSELVDKVESAKQNFLMCLEKEVKLIIQELTTNQSNNQIMKDKKLINNLDNDEQYTIKINPEIKLLLRPLKGIIETINQHFDNKKLEITDKIDELQKSQRLLENSLDRTRAVETKENELINRLEYLNQMNHELQNSNNQLEDKNKILIKSKLELDEIIDNLNDENKNLKDDNKELLKEIEEREKENEELLIENNDLRKKNSNLNNHLQELMKHNELSFELKEQTIILKVKKDIENLSKQLNEKFSELLKELKDETDKLLSPSDKKRMFDEIHKFIKKYHEFAHKKVRENTQIIDDYANISMSFMNFAPSTNKS